MKGTATPCFTTTVLEQYLASGRPIEDEELIKNVAAIAYAGE